MNDVAYLLLNILLQLTQKDLHGAWAQGLRISAAMFVTSAEIELKVNKS